MNIIYIIRPPYPSLFFGVTHQFGIMTVDSGPKSRLNLKLLFLRIR